MNYNHSSRSLHSRPISIKLMKAVIEQAFNITFHKQSSRADLGRTYVQAMRALTTNTQVEV